MTRAFSIILGFVALVALATPASAAIFGPDLATFAVLGAQGVTNVPTSTIGGNLGSAPNPSVGGGYVFTSGSLHSNTALAQSAQLQLDAAVITLAAFGAGNTVTGGNLDLYQALNGGVISPGTYTVPAAAENLVGTLILDGGGSNTAVWVFQMPSTFITATTSNVIVQNVGDGSGVGLYWNVGSAATLNGPTFAGNVLAQTLISSDGNLTIECGRLLSATSQVTLIMDNISIECGEQGHLGFGSSGFDQGGTVGQTVPEPGSFVIFGSLLAGLFGLRKGFLSAALTPLAPSVH